MSQLNEFQMNLNPNFLEIRNKTQIFPSWTLVNDKVRVFSHLEAHEIKFDLHFFGRNSTFFKPNKRILNTAQMMIGNDDLPKYLIYGENYFYAFGGSKSVYRLARSGKDGQFSNMWEKLDDFELDNNNFVWTSVIL